MEFAQRGAILPNKPVLQPAKLKRAVVIVVPPREVKALKKVTAQRASEKHEDLPQGRKKPVSSGIESSKHQTKITRDMGLTSKGSKRRAKVRVKTYRVVDGKMQSVRTPMPASKSRSGGTISVDAYRRKMNWLFPSAGRYGSSRAH